MKLRALVLEDEWAIRNHLVELLQSSGRVEVIGAVATSDAARQALDAGSEVDVVFVDVQLVGSARDDDGLELVRARSAEPGAPMFVMATAFREHALEAFDLGVVDYLLKPFTEERVAQCIDRVRARHHPSPDGVRTPARIAARKKRALVFLRLDEVWAFEAAERLAYVHTARGKFEIDLSLSAIEASLGRTLVRTHRSWLVNLDHVKELEGHGSDTELLVGADPDGVRIPVSRDRAAAVREALLGNTTGLRPR